MEALAKHAAMIWKTVIVNAIAQFSVVLEWLHADTTSISSAYVRKHIATNKKLGLSPLSQTGTLPHLAQMPKNSH